MDIKRVKTVPKPELESLEDIYDSTLNQVRKHTKRANNNDTDNCSTQKSKQDVEWKQRLTLDPFNFCVEEKKIQFSQQGDDNLQWIDQLFSKPSPEDPTTGSGDSYEYAVTPRHFSF